MWACPRLRWRSRPLDFLVPAENKAGRYNGKVIDSFPPAPAVFASASSLLTHAHEVSVPERDEQPNSEDDLACASYALTWETGAAAGEKA